MMADRHRREVRRGMADREWVLLNPGPANTTRSVRAALVMPDLCHREPECFEMMRRCRDGVVRLAGAGPDRTAGRFTGSRTAAVGGGRCGAGVVRLAGAGPDWTAVLFTGSGTASVEAAICAAVPSDRALLVVNNG